MAQDAPASRHLLASFAHSSRPLVRTARAAVAVGAVALGASQLIQGPVTILQARSLYVRDFTQEYTLARATLAGDDPYATVSTLTERYVGTSFPAISRELMSAAPSPVPTADTSEIGNHPTPHPPPVALFALPLALMSFPTASAIWCAFELLCLAATLWLLARTDRARVGPIAIAAATVALVAWAPVAYELNFGQLTMPALALLAAARLAQARGRPSLAGVLIGAAILLKPTPWPVVLLLAAHRQWRLVGASIATVALGFGAAGAVLGPATIVRYFVEVLPWVNRVYAATFQNMSLWSVGWRLFYGTRGIGGVGFDSPPLIDAPALAPIAAALLPAGLLAVALLWSLRRPGVDICLGVGAALSALLSPIGWSFYAVLAIIAAWQIALALHRHGYPRRETNGAVLAALASVVSWPAMFQGQLSPTLDAGGNLAISFAEAQIHLTWTVAILIVAALAALLGSRGLVREPALDEGRAAADGGPMPTGTSGSLPRSGRAPRLGGIYVRIGPVEGAKLT